MKARFAFGLAVTLFTTHAEAAPSGREILVKQEAARKIPSFTAKATLATGDSGGAMRTKSFTWWRKLSQDGVHFAALTRFEAPASIRNEGLLLRERNGGDNDVLLYLPSFKKIRRVEPQSQSTSFMGSVFSYADVALPHADDFSAKVLREEKCGEASCFVLEVTPVSEKVRVTTGYGRSVEWVRADVFVTVRSELYDKHDKLWKKLEATDVREVDKQKWLAHEVKMEDVRDKRVTVLKLSNVKANVDIPDNVFTEQNLATEN